MLKINNSNCARFNFIVRLSTFAEISAGRGYQSGVRRQQLQFAPRLSTVNEDLNETNFEANREQS